MCAWETPINAANAEPWVSARQVYEGRRKVAFAHQRQKSSKANGTDRTFANLWPRGEAVTPSPSELRL